MSGDGGMMREHRQSMRKMHFQMLWVHWLTMGLGLWLATTPFAFGTFQASEFPIAILRVSEDRGLWDPAYRSMLTGWNNVIVGVLIMLFAGLSISPRGGWAQWANAFLGVWLLGAPLVFWTPDAAVYANDTLIGALVIALTILIPMMPGMAMDGMMDETDVPPGWTYSHRPTSSGCRSLRSAPSASSCRESSPPTSSAISMRCGSRSSAHRVR